MREIQKMFEETLKGVPRMALEILLREKIKAAGGRPTAKVVAKIADALFAGEDAEIDVPGIKGNLEFTDEDMRKLEEKVKFFYSDGLAPMVKSTSDNIAETMYDALHEKLSAEITAQKQEHAAFKKRLHGRYGIGLDKLRMMLTMVREWAGDLHSRKTAEHGGKASVLDDVLHRNHVRGCQVVTEIIDLLENGLADGAMARWRTLHELAAVSTFLRRHGEDCAIRYRDFQIVESKRAADLYKVNHAAFGFRPMGAKQEAELEKAFAQMLAKHGPTFGNEYGWASIYLPGNSGNFAKIEAQVGQPEMRSVYKMASYNVHATPKGAFYRIGAIDGAGAIIGGYSNAGLTEPAQNTAATFVELCNSVAGDETTYIMDDLVVMKILRRLMFEIPRDIWKAERQLKKDDRAYREHLKAGGAAGTSAKPRNRGMVKSKRRTSHGRVNTRRKKAP
jgi:hypothetical protein